LKYSIHPTSDIEVYLNYLIENLKLRLLFNEEINAYVVFSNNSFYMHVMLFYIH